MKDLIALAATLASCAQAIAAEEAMDGAALYQQNCASCHGTELQGQPNWRSPGPDGRLPAPPHDATGHTWHHGDDILFRNTRDGTAAVVGGGYESNMPGFGDSLRDAEIRAILDYIKSTWPERERAYQRERTRQE
ncbi:cytochrome c [Phaeobacter sp. B1627]|uniref:c-type cytochrome n=1 Tax=Phaeobacter sp. B1627 TaxID=2583809 RepID=UPI00111A061A|nr:c-type cytochrome [Phaeobacter sp. B1627]TNJ43245.1 cytochrome c [Phaeobacter sp. B1627]